MSPSIDPRSSLTSPIETIDIVPPIPPIKPYITIPGHNYTIKYIHTYMKAYHDKTDTNIKSMNDHITSMLETHIDKSVKTNNQDERITELSSQLPT